MKSDRKQTIFFIIILLVMSVGIGYAFLTTTLTIDGVSDIDSAVWDIHFENVYVMSGSVTGDQVISPATIGNNGTSLSYHVKLKKPGDYYEVLVNAVNDGTLDAQIDNVEIKINGVEGNIPPYLVFFYVNDYGNRPIIEAGQVLYSGSDIPYCFKVLYKPNITISDLPTDDVSLDISINITYSQFVSQYNYNNKYVYTSDTTKDFVVGHYLPNNGLYYDNYDVPLSNFGKFFLRFYVKNNKINTAFIGISLNNNIYYIQGGDGGASYNSNKDILLSAFGDSICHEDSDTYYCDDFPNCDTYNYYRCDKYGYKIIVNDDGGVSSEFNHRSCYITSKGDSSCYISGTN